jgi:hypothetical protein
MGLALLLIGLGAFGAPATVGQDSADNDFNPADDPYYSVFLAAAGEERLQTTGAPDMEVLRFLWLRTWHPAIVVRVERHDEAYLVTGKVVEGQAGYYAGKVGLETSGSTTAAEWARLGELLSAVDFFNQPPYDVWVKRRRERCLAWWEANPDGNVMESPEYCGIGVDGAMWIVEYAGSNTYQAVDRYGPDGAFRKIGLDLLALARIEVDSAEVY